MTRIVALSEEEFLAETYCTHSSDSCITARDELSTYLQSWSKYVAVSCILTVVYL